MTSSVALALALLGLIAVVVVALRSRVAIRSLWAAVERSRLRHDDLEARVVRMQCELWGAHLGAVRGLDESIPFTSQHGEDLYVIRHLGIDHCGYFVEVGAHDGITFSNTYGLEKLGWRGMLVEANPDLVARCRVVRPDSVVVHAAIGGVDADGAIAFSVASGGGSDLLSFIDADSRHRERIHSEGGTIREVEVPYRSLDDVLSDAPEIDFMSIDIEGGERDALGGMDFERHHPRILMVENNAIGSDTRVRAYLEARGYRLGDVLGCNEVFVREDSGEWSGR